MVFFMAKAKQKPDRTYTVIEKFMIIEHHNPVPIIICTDDSCDSGQHLEYRPTAMQFIVALAGDKIEITGNKARLVPTAK